MPEVFTNNEDFEIEEVGGSILEDWRLPPSIEDEEAMPGDKSPDVILEKKRQNEVKKLIRSSMMTELTFKSFRLPIKFYIYYLCRMVKRICGNQTDHNSLHTLHNLHIIHLYQLLEETA